MFQFQRVGITRLFITMVLRARDSTIIIAVAAENPPINARRASMG